MKTTKTKQTSDALYLIGCGTPTPTKERFGTSYVLKLAEQYLMIDCGPAATHKLVKAGLFPTQIDYLLFTHHHSDHNSDYPCFLLCRWDQSTGKEGQLNVLGPAPIEWITERLIGSEGAFVYDWKARVEAPVSQSVHVNRGGALPRPQPKVNVKDIVSGEVIRRNNWTLTTQTVHHVQPWLESLAYRVESARGTIVFAGDMQPSGPVELAQGADVLVVNCWDHQDAMDANGEASGQTGTLDAARMAKDAGAKKLILTHIGPRLCQPDSKKKAIRDITNIYLGEVVFGEELMEIALWP